jgi:hypothetical protein
VVSAVSSVSAASENNLPIVVRALKRRPGTGYLKIRKIYDIAKSFTGLRFIE